MSEMYDCPKKNTSVISRSNRLIWPIIDYIEPLRFRNRTLFQRIFYPYSIIAFESDLAQGSAHALKKVGTRLKDSVTQKRNQGPFPVTLGYTKT